MSKNNTKIAFDLDENRDESGYMDALLTIKSLMAKEFPERKWLVDKLIPAGAITILSGEPASFKTYFLLETAISVAKGRQLFGQFDTKKTGVLMIDEENGESLLQSRLAQLGVTGEELPIYFWSFQDFVLSDDTVNLAILECLANNINLIMIDSLVRIHASDENRANEMAAVFRHLRRFTARGITVLVTHHNRKPGANYGNARHDMRGSSDILASIDSHLSLKRRGKDIVVSQTKARYSEEHKPFGLRVVSDNNSFQFEYGGSVKDKPENGELVGGDSKGLVRVRRDITVWSTGATKR